MIKNLCLIRANYYTIFGVEEAQDTDKCPAFRRWISLTHLENYLMHQILQNRKIFTQKIGFYNHHPDTIIHSKMVLYSERGIPNVVNNPC